MSSDAHAAGHGEAEVHVVPIKILVGVWAALMVLTVLTVAVTYVDFGDYNIVAALFIAVVKASMVMLYFMHLRYDSPFHSLLMVSALLFVGIFISIALLDTAHYQNTFYFPVGSALNEQSVPK